MNVGERDPAASDDWPLGKLIRPAVKKFRSERAVVTKAREMGPDYEFSRGTLRNYTNGFREDGVGGERLVVAADTVRRIAAVLELDPREALAAAGLSGEAERHVPKSATAPPLDSAEVLAKKVVSLDYDKRAALQTIVDSLIDRTDGQPVVERAPRVVSTQGGEAWTGARSSDGRQGSAMPASESQG